MKWLWLILLCSCLAGCGTLLGNYPYQGNLRDPITGEIIDAPVATNEVTSTNSP